MAELRRSAASSTASCPAPRTTLLTVDATTGQNGLRQAQLFSQAVPVDGVVSPTGRHRQGGIALYRGRAADPVKLIGVGEVVEDLRPFDADEFARALVGLDAG